MALSGTFTDTVMNVPVTGVQSSTTNTTPSQIHSEIGWGFIAGAGTAFASKAVTFRAAFQAAPIVVVVCAGYKDSTDPTAVGDVTGNWEVPNMNMGSVTTSGFTALFGTIDASTVASTRRVLFTWIAIGN